VESTDIVDETGQADVTLGVQTRRGLHQHPGIIIVIIIIIIIIIIR